MTAVTGDRTLTPKSAAGTPGISFPPSSQPTPRSLIMHGSKPYGYVPPTPPPLSAGVRRLCPRARQGAEEGAARPCPVAIAVDAVVGITARLVVVVVVGVGVVVVAAGTFVGGGRRRAAARGPRGGGPRGPGQHSRAQRRRGRRGPLGPTRPSELLSVESLVWATRIRAAGGGTHALK